MIHFRALGEVAAFVDGERVALGGARQRRLLAMLLINRNTVVSTDRLADAVFAGEPTEAAATTLRSYVARVRRVVEGHDARVCLLTRPPGYSLQVPDEMVDVALFEAALGDAEHALGRGDPEAAGAAARLAMDRWTGDPYPEFDDEGWAQPESQRLGELLLVVADHRFAAELACGRAAAVVSDLERMVAVHPLREGFRSQLMVALYRSGRQADALRGYQQYRGHLVEELGLEPSPALAGLEARILAHDPELRDHDGTQTLHGYRLGERLGSGHDGALYAARIPGVGREFVVRSYRSDIADDPHFVRTFESDARQLASLRHPAVVPLHDYWRGPHEAYLVMPRLHGGTLEDRLHRGPLARRELVAVVERIGDALAAASAVGLAHGRICPANVLFDDGGQPFITDFVLGARAGAATVADISSFAELLRCCTTSDEICTQVDRAAACATSMSDVVARVRALLDASPAPTANPYKGLEAFDEVDAPVFFGRERVVDALADRLGGDTVRGRLVLIVGGSGTGKSSIVRAGLLPRLRAGAVPGSDRWLITTCTPGTSPFQRLGDALTRLSVGAAVEHLDAAGTLDAAVRRVARGTEILLVLDQLEELFTSGDPAIQRRFLDELTAAITAPDSKLRVVATLRADYFDRPLAVPSIGQLVDTVTVTIPAMAPAELEAAVVGPAASVGRTVEGPLIAELVGAVARDAAALPALQFTLYALAERCGTSLTLSAYRDLGGVSGAVAARAEQLYLSVPDDERPVIRRLFERMVVVGEAEATRRRVPIADLAGGPDILAVIERWAAERLLTLDHDPRSHVPTVEIAHEALIREWPRLGDWIQEDRDAILALVRIRDAARSWNAAHRDPGLLARGLPLESALEVASHRPLDLAPLDHEFLEASRLAGEEAAAEQAARLGREQRANRRLRWQLAALGALLVVALIAGAVAVEQRRNADRSRRFATARELAAAAESNLDVDPERSILLALEAVDIARSNRGGAMPEAISALHAATVQSRIVSRIPGLGGTVAWSPTGEYVVSEGPEDSGMVDLRDPESGQSVRSWRGDDIDINDVVFSSDGSMLATTGDDGRLRIWDPATGELRLEFGDEGSGSVWGVAFSGDGARVAASWIEAGGIRVVDVATGRLVREIVTDPVMNVSLSRDGSRIAFGAGDGTAFVHDVTTGDVVRRLEAPGAGWLGVVRFSPDDRLIAQSGDDGVLRLWDAATGARLNTLGAPGAASAALTWSRDGARLAVGSANGTVRVWDVADGKAELSLTLTAQDTQNGVQGVAFSPDGSRLVTGDLGIASILIWDVSPRGAPQWAIATTRPFSFVALAVTPADQAIAEAEGGGVASYSLDDGTARQIAPGPTHTELRIAVDAAGTLVATAVVDPGEPVEVWDVASGARLTSFVPPGIEDFVTGLAWSPDGEHLAVAAGDEDSSSIVVVDRQGAVLARYHEEPGVYLRESYFSPDGRVLAIPRRPLRQAPPDTQGVWLWDWRAGEMIGRIDTQTLVAAWDSSGRHIATIAELESVGAVWDVDTLTRAATFTGTSGFTDVRFSPDGSEVATSGVDGEVNLWSAETGAPVATLRGHDKAAVSVAFALDGRRLASVDVDGELRIWALDLDDLVGIAERRLTRELTTTECRRYLHRDAC